MDEPRLRADLRVTWTGYNAYVSWMEDVNLDSRQEESKGSSKLSKGSGVPKEQCAFTRVLTLW